jgi:hypothetical protein
VAGDRVHQRGPRRAQRGGGRGRPGRHDPHVVGERARGEEAPAAARSLRGVPHEAGDEDHACTLPPHPTPPPPQMQTEPSKRRLSFQARVGGGSRSRGGATNQTEPSRSQPIADAPGLFLWGLGGTLAEKQPTDRISGARHGRARGGELDWG